MTLASKVIAVQSKLKAPKRINGGVYAIINPVDQIYIGSTSSFTRRFYQYKGLYEKSQKKLYESFLKYGVDNHQFLIIEYCDTSIMRERERYWGEHFDSINDKTGLNDVLPYGLYSNNIRRKIGDKHRGKKLSKEQKEVLLNSIRGKKQSEEHIAKRKMFGEKNPAFGNSYFKGRHHSEETKAKLSADRKGKGLLGYNHNAKKVIDTETGRIYLSAKEVAIIFKINYSTIKSWLQGRNNNNRFKYIK